MPKRSSLKRALILPFVVLIALMTGTLGVLWYWTGSKTVATLSQQLIHEMAERINLAVEKHLSDSGAVLEAVFPTGTSAPEDLTLAQDALRAKLWTASSLTGIPGSYVYYANRHGQAMALTRLDHATAQLRTKADADAHRVFWQLTALDHQPTYLFTETTLFEPRSRPWYELAQHAQGHQWTPVYIDFAGQQLVMTRARAVHDLTGQFQGVVATDVSLKGLQTFIETLPLSEGSHALILQKDGTLIASSAGYNLAANPTDQLQLVSIKTSQDPLLAAIYRALNSPHTSHTLKDANGDYYEVAYRALNEHSGLDWVAVVVVPHNVMLAGIRLHVVLVVGLGLLALGTALALGLRIFGSVANDMKTLTQAVRKVGDGDIHTPIRVTRNDEIGELAQNFHSMRNSLFTDALTGSANRSALMHLLTTLMVKTPRPFALLFIDLNRFKPLNDQYGHDNGDLALIEVAQRLRSQLRADDVVARLGGDEFVVVLPGVTTDEHVQRIRQSLVECLAKPLTTLAGEARDSNVTVGAAIGHALFPRDGEDAQSLLKYADLDMYRRKKPTPRTQAISEPVA